VDEFDIVVTGRAGHTSYPHLAADPVSTLCRCVLAVQDVLRGTVDPMHPATVTVTQLEGGRAPNVIPEVARARGTVRTMDADDARRLHAAIAEMVSATARAHGCTGTVVVEPGEPVLVNDPALAAGATRWLRAFGVPRGASFASCGSDDFSSYSLVGNGLPILMMFVGTAEGPQPPVLHDPRFLPDDARIGDVARALLAGVLAGLTTALSPAR
jgi:metal-dependent amidase/aminoacylase/carboxypeptidase family protein